MKEDFFDSIFAISDYLFFIFAVDLFVARGQGLANKLPDRRGIFGSCMQFLVNAPGIQLAFLLALGGLCLAVVTIDLRARIIPDSLNAAIALLGLFNAGIEDSESIFRQAGMAVGSGLVAGLVVWLVRLSYFRFRGVEGIGLGDVKFVGAAGIWTGIAGLPTLILIASGSALAIVGAGQLIGRPLEANSRLPFGPFLAFALWLTVGLAMWG